MFKREDVFTWANAADARSYVGKTGFFACCPQELLHAITDGRERTLVDVDCSTLSQMVFKPEGTNLGTCYFIPSEKVDRAPRVTGCFSAT